jgi:hypothetical protein
MRISEFCYERYYDLAGADYRAVVPSHATLDAIKRLDVCRLVKQRRSNVQYLYSALHARALRLVYPTDWPGWIPMAVPAFVVGADRRSVQQQARRAGVLLATLTGRWDHVPIPDCSAFESERYYLNNHVLIPINEHINSERMRQVVKILNEL